MSHIKADGIQRIVVVLAVITLGTLFILACGDDATDTPTGQADISTPTTASPLASATPVPAGMTPVETRLKVAMATPSYQFTMRHPMNQIAAPIMPQSIARPNFSTPPSW